MKDFRTYWLHASTLTTTTTTTTTKPAKKSLKNVSSTAPHLNYTEDTVGVRVNTSTKASTKAWSSQASRRSPRGRHFARVKFNATRAVTWRVGSRDTPTFMIVAIVLLRFKQNTGNTSNINDDFWPSPTPNNQRQRRDRKAEKQRVTTENCWKLCKLFSIWAWGFPVKAVRKFA